MALDATLQSTVFIFQQHPQISAYISLEDCEIIIYINKHSLAMRPLGGAL